MLSLIPHAAENRIEAYFLCYQIFHTFPNFLVKQEMLTERDFVMRADPANVPQPAAAEVSLFNIFTC